MLLFFVGRRGNVAGLYVPMASVAPRVRRWWGEFAVYCIFANGEDGFVAAVVCLDGYPSIKEVVCLIYNLCTRGSTPWSRLQT